MHLKAVETVDVMGRIINYLRSSLFCITWPAKTTAGNAVNAIIFSSILVWVYWFRDKRFLCTGILRYLP